MSQLCYTRWMEGEGEEDTHDLTTGTVEQLIHVNVPIHPTRLDTIWAHPRQRLIRPYTDEHSHWDNQSSK